MTDMVEAMEKLGTALRELKTEVSGGSTAQVIYIAKGSRLTTVTVMPADDFRPVRLHIETGRSTAAGYLTFAQNVLHAREASAWALREVLYEHFDISSM